MALPLPPPRTGHELRGHEVAQFSRHLRQEMPYRVYGSSGVPVVAFPTSEARFSQWEDFGMVEAVRGFIESGAIQLFTVDTIDKQTFFPEPPSYADKQKAMRRYEQYLAYVHEEFMPTIIGQTGQRPILTGCSMGAYHSANYFFRFPANVAGVIALSGVYSLYHFLGLTRMAAVKANSPLRYLAGGVTNEQRRAYEHAKLIFCAGQDASEQEMLADTEALGKVLKADRIPAWVDIWGPDVTHDWPWWKQQLNYFLPKVLN